MVAHTASTTRQPAQRVALGGVLLFCAGLWAHPPARSQEPDFARACLRVVAGGLTLESSPACVNAFRRQPAARAQFVQTLQDTLAQAEALSEPANPNAAARSLKRLHERATSEAGRWAGGGTSYYGAHH
ncbi:hypothetical protein [Hydrogenophaga sp.]|uniref:hypothetical protein n=1 Tax=Hydrogenophaga sp. TaxID=1904254 RepID=UPI002FCAC359